MKPLQCILGSRLHRWDSLNNVSNKLDSSMVFSTSSTKLLIYLLESKWGCVFLKFAVLRISKVLRIQFSNR